MATTDRVDEIVALWQEREPSLDASSLHVVGRLLSAAAALDKARERAVAEYGLTLGDFDVIATLRRIDDKAGVNPKHLAASSLITSGAMTTRLDRLEAAGLVRRVPDPDDRRAVRVRLTPQGGRTAGLAVRSVLRVHEQYLAPLSPGDRSHLVAALRKLTAVPDAPRADAPHLPTAGPARARNAHRSGGR